MDELTTRFEKWLYVIRNLNRLDRVPDKLREQVFEKLFKTAEIARFTPEQVRSYEDILRHYRDLKNSLDTARKEGREAEREAIARKMRAAGLPLATIASLAGLATDQIEPLT